MTKADRLEGIKTNPRYTARYWKEFDYQRRHRRWALAEARALRKIANSYLQRNDTLRAEKAEARIWELKEMVALLLLMIKHETNLPDGAANGVVTNDGSDEGIVRAGQIMDEAFQLLR